MTADPRIEAVALVIDGEVRQALRDYGISDEAMRGDPELWSASLLAAEAALTAADAVAWCDDMEKAPKNHVIDVWLGDAEPADVAFYCTPGTRRSPGWAWEQGKWRPATGLNMTTFVVPTHWRHLPEPPR